MKVHLTERVVKIAEYAGKYSALFRDDEVSGFGLRVYGGRVSGLSDGAGRNLAEFELR